MNGSVSHRRPKEGIVLILVLVVIALLSLAAYTFSDLMLTEREATLLQGEQIQAQALVESGVDLVRLYLSQDAATRTAGGGHYDNPSQFQAIVVVDDEDADWRGRFSVVAPALDAYGELDGIRFGLVNESARLNLNALLLADLLDEEQQREVLLLLPGMTEDVADAILDWVDEDDEPREYGAEIDYYGTLQPPYAPSNGSLKTVEELLLVRGVTPELLFGMDANRNGVVDAHERDSAATTMTTDLSLYGGQLDLGWSAYLTLYSAERNASSTGMPLIELNAEDLEQLHADLSAVMEPDWATFIVAYRQNGPYGEEEGQEEGEEDQGPPGDEGAGGGGGASDDRESGGDAVGPGAAPGGNSSGEAIAIPMYGGGSPSFSLQAQPSGSGGGGGGGGASPGPSDGGSPSGGDAAAPEEPVDGREVDLAQPAKQEIEQVLDLIGARVRVTFAGEQEPVIVTSPFADDPDAMREYLPILMDNVTVRSEAVIPGRVNINEAPRTVLMAVPGLTEEVVDQILALRDVDPSTADATRLHETWLLTEGILSLEQMKSLMPFITARGDVFRAQIVGYYDSAGVSARAEVVLDATVPLPRVLFWRELGQLGRGFTLDVLSQMNQGR